MHDYTHRLLLALALCFAGIIAPAGAATPPALSNPVVGAPSTDPVYLGSLQGQGTVSAGGNASYVIGLELPPGVRGMAPQLSLNYNSNMKNGLLGLGWFLQGATSAVTRCPQNTAQDGQIRAVDHSADDRFCLDGHRLMVTNSGTYGVAGTVYRTEHDNFSRVESLGSAGTGPAEFEVRTKGGLIKHYGATTDSRIEEQGGSTVRVWALSAVEDQLGNRYDLVYSEDNAEGEYYPIEITYGGNPTAGTSPSVTVDLSYEARTDNLNAFEAGSELHRHPMRLAKIEASVGAQLVSEYQLSYEEVGRADLSRLTEVTRCDGSSLCQDPIVLNWVHDGSVSFTSSMLSVPYSGLSMGRAPAGGKSYPPRWHDMNGDGKPDYVFSHKFPSQPTRSFEIALSNGSGGYTTETWTTPGEGYLGQETWADMNGDGKTDVIMQQPSGYTMTFTIALAGTGGFTSSTWIVDTRLYNQIEYSFRDMNGDRLPDLIAQEKQYAHPYYYGYTRVMLNTGSGFSASSTWAYTAHQPGSIQSIELVDLNGDSLPDHVHAEKWVRLNNGSGFDAEQDWGATGYRNSAIYADYNGDGLTDRRINTTAGSCCELQYGTGASFVDSGYNPFSIFNPFVDFEANGLNDSYYRTYNVYSGQSSVRALLAKNDSGTGYTYAWINSGTLGYQMFQQVADINGDGLQDYTASKTVDCGGGGWQYNTRYWCETGQLKYFKADGAPLHLLESVTNNLGAKTEFTYSSLTDNTIYTKGSSAVFPEQDVQDSRKVVSHIEQSDGIGGVLETEYTYEALIQDLEGRGSLGFAKITAKNLDQNTTTITEYGQAYPYASRPTMTEVRRTSDNRLLSSSDITYGVHGTIGSGPVFPYVDTRISKAFDLGDGRLLFTSTTTGHCDAYGNITENTVETVDHENTQTFKTQTLATYTTDDSATWRIAQVDSQTVKAWLNGSYNSALDKTTTHTYDAGTGQRDSSTRQPGGGTGIELTTTLVHDAHGNVTSETVSGPGITSRASTIAYDTQGQFPLTMTNALGHAATLTWNADFGKKASQTDINGQTTSWTYNTFGQQTLETRPDGTTSAATVHEYTGTNPDEAFYVEATSTGTGLARTYHDKLGRKLRTETQSFTGATVNQVTEHDSKGRAYRTSEPYFSSDPVVWNTQGYDDLSRVTSITAADPSKSTTTNYDGFSVAVTDAMSRTSTQWLNAAGQIIQSDDDTGTSMMSEYDPVGNRTKVTNADGDALQSSVLYTYDRLGRLLTQNDPDHGIYTYTYNALGEKLTDISPKMAAASQSVSLQYDLLGRTTSRTEPEGTTTWTYDNTTGGNLGKGQLHSESLSGFSKTYSYNPSNYGRLTSASTAIGSSTYTNSSTYDAQGKVASLTYPGGFTVAHTYNALGFLERVQQPGGSTVHYQLVGTDAAGRMTSEWKGDGSLISQSYEGNSSRITAQHTQNGATDIQHLTYGYDSAGNMTSRNDVVNTLSESFTFDNLDRLTSAQVAGATAATYDFDVTGNITKKSDMGDPFLYTTAKVHAVTQLTVGATTKNLSYDNNGNLSNGDDLPTVTWSSYNKPTKLVKGPVTYDFKYGPNRKRYQKDHSGNTTHYAGGSYEKIWLATSTEERHVVRANGKAVMVRKTYNGSSPSHFYVHRDHVGSVTALTLENTGAVVERYSYDAWGLRRGATDWTSTVTGTTYGLRGYTGHEHLDDIGVIHMNGRIYSPKLGRMLSPDPVTQAPENGQNYNRYTYALNNPLKYTDPSGFEFIGGGQLNDGGTQADTHWSVRGIVGFGVPYYSGFGIELAALRPILILFGVIDPPGATVGDIGADSGGQLSLGEGPVGINPVVGDLKDGFKNECHEGSCQVYTVESEGAGSIIDQRTKWEGVDVWDTEIPIGDIANTIAEIGGFIAKVPTPSAPSYVYRSGTEFGHQEVKQEVFEQLWVSVIVDGVVVSRNPVPGRRRRTGETEWTAAAGGPISRRITRQVCVDEECTTY